MQESPNGNIYAYSWYLDIVAPKWCALITPNYSHIFPLPYKTRFGQQIGYHPIFAQQLGLFSRECINSNIFLQFIQNIPFKKIEVQANNIGCINPEKCTIRQRTNYKLSLSKSYEELFANYNRSNLRNCAKAYKQGIVVKKIEFDEYWQFYVQHKRFAARNTILKRLETLIKCCLEHQSGFILGAYTPNMTLCSTLFIGSSNNTLYTLFGDSSELGFKHRAQFAIYDQLIKKYANTDMSLDFEGSDIPTIASVFKGFGPIYCPYLHIEQNSLPHAINTILNTENWLKQALKRTLLPIKSKHNQ